MQHTFVNLTPHAIVMNDGRRFEPSGNVARVSTSFTEVEGDFVSLITGDVEGLPSPQDGIFYIASSMVKSATTRPDVIAPATGHPETRRNDKGHIISVPCFVR